MAKEVNEFTSCAYCKKRAQCWKPERYGDRGERGKRPYPTTVSCLSFRADEELKQKWS